MRNFKIILGISAFLILMNIYSEVVFGFPQNTRLGYANCMSCHISPTGDGSLSDYGKSTEPELSTFSFDDQFVEHKIIRSADVRYLWLDQKSREFNYSDQFLMQSDFEIGFQNEGWTAVVQAGAYHSKPRDRIVSFKHYLMYSTGQHNLRLGRFAPAFGINTDDHTLPGRNGIGLDVRSASLNLEYSYLGKQTSLILTNIFGCQGGMTSRNVDQYCDKEASQAGFVAYVGYAWSKLIFTSLATWKVSNYDIGREATAIGFVAGSKWLYAIGELTSYKVLGQNSAQHNVGWIDFIMSVAGLDFGYTYARYENDRTESGYKMRWLPIPGIELTTKYLKSENGLEKYLTIFHLYL